MSPARIPIDVYLERGGKRVFAGAIEWPAWCRSARDEPGALGALVAYAPRYAATREGFTPRFRPPRDVAGLHVVQRLKGDATTDFGAPSATPAADREPVSARQLARLRGELEACWAALDRACDAAEGAALRTGPRGGGRTLDAIRAHVAGAEGGYLGRLAARGPKTDGMDPGAALELAHAAVIDALTKAVTEGLPAAGPRGGLIWAPRYFVRRTAWHALDHAWEVEDRSPGV
jgi:hypothetical protein